MEATVLALGAAMVRSAAKLWLADRPVAADVTVHAVDLLVGRTAGVVDQRRVRRLFEQLEEVVAERLAPLVEHEFRGVPANERAAALEAVQATFAEAALTDDDLFAADLDAGYAYRYLRRAVPGMPDRFALSDGGIRLYDRILRECCAYLVQIVTTLPRFQVGALTELLRRETQVLAMLKEVLARLPERRDATDFGVDYRRQVVTALDRMTYFGATLSEPSRRYPLSVAYISLGVSSDLPAPVGDGGWDEPVVRTGAGIVRVEELLPGNSRLFLRGEAGSGKTTLLQWLAVRCALGELSDVDGWVDVVPFLLRLRRYATGDPPPPQQFLDDVGRHVAEEMPRGWVHERLRSGRAVVLVDGVDELPEQRRAAAREWLRELIGQFPAARYVVTSRPAAVHAAWLRGEEFVEAELQPMTPQDVRAFVHRWHEAMRAQSADDEERHELDEYEARLATLITERRALRRIAENPLLCALMCALHRDRRGLLPENRMELYEVTLHLLLERRDAERGLEPPDGLSRTEKTLLLQDIAYWLVRNGWSDAETGRVAERMATKLASMAQVRAEPGVVFRHLLERSGLLREPVAGRVDFVHRSFQEYLAAKAAVDADDIGVLVDNAHLDQWREVVVMAAGHASPRQREELLYGLVRQEGGSRQERQRRHLLGLACLETSSELSEALRAEISSRAASLVPPQSPAAARALAGAGEFALDLLAKVEPRSARSIVATIQAAVEIGGDAALSIVARCADGPSGQAAVRELVRAWPRFDPAEYARTVLSRVQLPGGSLRIDDPSLAAGLEHIPSLRGLECRFRYGHGDVAYATRVPDLEVLVVSDPWLRDLRPLAGTRLRKFALLPTLLAPEVSHVDVRSLAHVPTITRVDLLAPAYGWEALSTLPVLTGLQLFGVGDGDALAALRPLTGLTTVGLRYLHNLPDLTPLGFLQHPRWFGLHVCPDLVDVRLLARWAAALRRLWLRTCPRLDYQTVPVLPELELLDLSGSGPVDLTIVAQMERLQTLRLTRMDYALDLAPLRQLERLRSLWLYDSGDIDLTPLAGKENLIVYTKRDQAVHGADLLGPGSKVTRR